MRIGVAGAGAVGSRAVRQLAATAGVDEVFVADLDDDRARTVARAISGPSIPVGRDDLTRCDVVILASPVPHSAEAELLLRAGAAVVSVSDDLDDVRALLQLGP